MLFLKLSKNIQRDQSRIGIALGTKTSHLRIKRCYHNVTLATNASLPRVRAIIPRH